MPGDVLASALPHMLALRRVTLDGIPEVCVRVCECACVCVCARACLCVCLLVCACMNKQASAAGGGGGWFVGGRGWHDLHWACSVLATPTQFDLPGPWCRLRQSSQVHT